MACILRNTYRHDQFQSGFTLLELSIVIIITGLLAGSILAGPSLIKAAEISSTIADINSMRTAFNQFRDKYNCIPGDCAFQSRFFDIGNGDGNSYIQCGYTNPWCPAPIHEHSAAFAAMQLAGFIRSDAEEADGFEPTRLRECQLFMHAEFADGSDLYDSSSGNLPSGNREPDYHSLA